MGIAEFLDAPDGAVLVAINGEVELVTTRHETPMRLTIERFPLGPVASVDAIMALLDLHGVLPTAVSRVGAVPPAPALPAPSPRPALGAPPRLGGNRQPVVAAPDRRHACPVCAKDFKRASQLIRHQRTMHGVVAATADLPCPTCGHPCRGRAGLTIHQAKKHGSAAILGLPPTERATVAATGVPASPPGPPVVAAMPADPRGMCDACGMPNRNHLACEECGRRIGPGHTVDAPAKQRGGKVWCADCLETLRLQARYDGKAA